MFRTIQMLYVVLEIVGLLYHTYNFRETNGIYSGHLYGHTYGKINFSALLEIIHLKKGPLLATIYQHNNHFSIFEFYKLDFLAVELSLSVGNSHDLV